MPAKMCENAAEYLTAMRQAIDGVNHAAIDQVAARVFQAWTDDRLIVTLGNGGSASTASHFVADLVKTAAVDGQRRLRASCLTDNTALMTAIGNDLAYDQTFVYPLEALCRRGDVLIAISASGNSPNVVGACRWANEAGVDVVALTGFDGGAIAEIADHHIHVPSDNYGVIEDLHLSVGHMVSQGLRSLIGARCRQAACAV